MNRLYYGELKQWGREYRRWLEFLFLSGIVGLGLFLAGYSIGRRHMDKFCLSWRIGVRPLCILRINRKMVGSAYPWKFIFPQGTRVILEKDNER